MARTRIALTVAALALIVAACGRTAPDDALDDLGSDPDIAGVSITSPDAVVTTVPLAEGETTTTTAPIAPEEILYTVQPGDTLSVIADRYNVTTDDLAAYNGITDANDISPGLEIAIPPQPAPVEVDVADPDAAEGESTESG
ncbi:MAG: LysM peptidoglycan-binding domain-containing protein [Actinomycetota bacterium]